MAVVNVRDFDTLALEPFVLISGNEYELAGIRNYTVKVKGIETSFNNVRTVSDLAECLKCLTYIAELPNKNEVEMPYGRFKAHPPIHSLIIPIWEASRTMIISRNVRDNPVRSKFANRSEEKRVDKIHISIKDSLAAKRFASALELIQEREKGNRDRITNNLRSIRAMADVIDNEIRSGRISPSTIRSCGDYLTLLTLIAKPTNLEIMEIRNIKRKIDSLVIYTEEEQDG